MVLLKDGGKYYLKDSFTSANRPCTDDIFGVYSPDGRTVQSAFKDMTDFIKQIYVPAKNFKMLEPMLPAHLRPLVKKQSWLAAVFCRLF